MRPRAALLALALAGCGAQSTPVQNYTPEDILANIATDPGDTPWTMVSFDYRFSRQSSARKLPVPSVLRGARLGYFDEPQMLAQLDAKQRAAMKADNAGLSATLDLDHDGMPETYRTGFWRRAYESGTFVAVFEGGHFKDVQSSENDEWFFSWHSGALVVSGCNCSRHGEIAFAQDRLKVTWSD